MDAERKRKQKIYESMILQLNEIFPNHSLQAIMDAVKKSKLNFDLAMQYVLETPLEPLPVIAPQPTRDSADTTATDKTTMDKTIIDKTSTVHETSAPETKTTDATATPDMRDSSEVAVSEAKKKKPSSAALKRKVPQVKEMIPDASDEVILRVLKRVNGDVDKCMLLLLEDPDAGTQRVEAGIEPLPSDSEGESEDEEHSDEELDDDSAGSFDPNDLADWDDQMMSEIDGWFVAPEQQPAQRIDQGPNLLHKLYQELADEEIARMLQAEWREPIALPKPDYNKRVVAPVSVSVPSVPPMPRRIEPTKEYDSAALATFMNRMRTSAPTTDEPIKVRAVRRAPQLRQLIHMLRREKELAVLRHKMMSTNLVVTDDKLRQEEERLKQEKAGLHELSVEDDTTPVPEDVELDESDVTVPAPLTQYLATQRDELASLQSSFSEGKVKQSTSLPFILSARLQDPADENSADAHLFPRPLHLYLIVVLVPAYPARLPRLFLRTDALESQLRDTTLQRLKHVLVQTAQSLRGSAMIARLIEVAEEFLCTAPSVRYDAATSRNDDREELTKDYADSMRHILTQKPSYSVLDSHDILNYRTLALQRAAESLAEYGTPSPGVLRVLLTHFQWDLNKLLTEYREAAVNGRLSVLFAEVGVTDDNTHNDDSAYCTQQFECPGCLEEYPLDHMCGLQCRHFYCLDCYHNYVTLKINEGASDDITCPAYKCKYIIDPVLLASLANAQLYNKYVRFVTKSFVERNPNIKWCPAAGCNFAVLAPGRERMIFCKCGSVWCFQCMGEGHWPSTCNELKWFKQIHDKHDPEADREMKTLQWLLSYTKDCPKCGNPIEKNGGCNHMSCGACKYQFCWICLAGWHPSHYSCTTKIKGKNERENLLQQFENNMSFYSMYVMHENERNARDVRLKSAVVSKMKHIARQADATIEDCESLANAVQYIYLCRHVIMNICVVGDYAIAHSIGGTQFFRGELRRIVTDMSLLRAILEGKSSKLSMEDLTSCAAGLKISLRDFTVKFGAWRQRVKRKQEERVERTMAQFEQ